MSSDDQPEFYIYLFLVPLARFAFECAWRTLTSCDDITTTLCNVINWNYITNISHQTKVINQSGGFSFSKDSPSVLRQGALCAYSLWRSREGGGWHSFVTLSWNVMMWTVTLVTDWWQQSATRWPPFFSAPEAWAWLTLSILLNSLLIHLILIYTTFLWRTVVGRSEI